MASQVSFGGKEKLLSLGTYPDVSLKEARGRRDDARKLLADGVDPSDNRKAVKSAKTGRAANSFEVVAREWYAKKLPGWAVSNADKIIKRLENDAFPWLGGRPIAEITTPELLKTLRRIEERGAVESAHRMRYYFGQVFRYAIATGRAERDVAADLRGALSTAETQHRAAISDPKAIGALLRAMARTVLDEVLQVRPDFIEHQLAHAVRDPNGRAYNRTAHLAERRKMMQQWEDYLDRLKVGAEVISIKAA